MLVVGLPSLARAALPFNERVAHETAASVATERRAALTRPEIADEKQRVPKPPPSEDKPRRDEKPKKEESSSSDDDSKSDCFFDCLWSMFSSSDHPSQSVAPPPPPESAPPENVPPESPATGEPPGYSGEEPTTPHWAAFTSAGMGADLGPAEVRDEYDAAVRLALDWFWPLQHGWQVDAGAGYSAAWGNPGFNYVMPTATDTTYDSPTSSRLDQFNLSVRGGQYLSVFGRSTLCYWGVGPGLYWVKESAEITYDVVKGGAVVKRGRRTDTLDRVRPGADLVLGLGWRLTRRNHQHLGLHLRGYAIPWKSERKNSQTLDFVGKRTIVGINVGIALSSERF
jgi:hypothetical protein